MKNSAYGHRDPLIYTCKARSQSLPHPVSFNCYFPVTNIAHLLQQCHKSKLVIFQEKILKVLKCYTFL